MAVFTLKTICWLILMFFIVWPAGMGMAKLCRDVFNLNPSYVAGFTVLAQAAITIGLYFLFRKKADWM